VRNPDKTVNYLIASLEDITERMKAEEEKECLMDSLAEKTKEMENFTSIIRHDLGNPLLSVDAFATMLDEYCGQLDQILENNSVSQELRDQMSSIVKSDIPEAVSFIQTGAADMQKLLKGLKQVADVGRRTLQIEPQDMNEIIRQIVGKLNFQINDCGASIAVEPLSACLGDAIQLNQVFSNLLTNALKYLDPNRKGSIHVSSRVEQGMSIYCIEDNGIGISPANKEKVFEIFHRVDPEGHVSGEGLGLTIVGHIIEQHKGRIWLESELGKGSKFFVSLPTVYMADSTPKATESNSLTQSKENIKQF
jgi:signal transduction histidine kinase